MTATRLDVFTYEEVSELVTRYSKEVGVTWPETMVKVAMALTAGNPFLLNLLCYYVIQQVYEKADGSLVVDHETITRSLEAWLIQSGGGLDDLKLCYAEPSSWSTFETTTVLHVLSSLSNNSGASCFEPLPSYKETDVYDYLDRYYPYVPIADLNMNSAFDVLLERDILRVSKGTQGREYAIRFGMLVYTLQRHTGTFENLLKERDYL